MMVVVHDDHILVRVKKLLVTRNEMNLKKKAYYQCWMLVAWTHM